MVYFQYRHPILSSRLYKTLLPTNMIHTGSAFYLFLPIRLYDFLSFPVAHSIRLQIIPSTEGLIVYTYKRNAHSLKSSKKKRVMVLCYDIACLSVIIIGIRSIKYSIYILGNKYK
jgi:hypothetical protein